jgi:hypothetical protein
MLPPVEIPTELEPFVQALLANTPQEILSASQYAARIGAPPSRMCERSREGRGPAAARMSNGRLQFALQDVVRFEIEHASRRKLRGAEVLVWLARQQRLDITQTLELIASFGREFGA